MPTGSTCSSAGKSSRSVSTPTCSREPVCTMRCGASKSVSAERLPIFRPPSRPSWRQPDRDPQPCGSMPDYTVKLKKGNFMQALDSIRDEAERLIARRDLPPDVKAGLDRIVGMTRGKFDLGGDTE